MLVTREETERFTSVFSYAGMGPAEGGGGALDAASVKPCVLYVFVCGLFTYTGLPVCDLRPRGPYLAFCVRSTPRGVWRPLFTVEALRYRSLFLSLTYVTAS